MLEAHEIELLVDVRRWPASRRHPQFHREALANSLEQAGVDYLWRGDLGGFRKPEPNSPNTGWKVGAFRAYADFMLTDEFHNIVEEVERLAGAKRTAFMCAEAVPWRCHRQLLADAFLDSRLECARISWTTAATSTSCRRSLNLKARKSITVGCSRVIINGAFRGLQTLPEIPR